MMRQVRPALRYGRYALGLSVLVCLAAPVGAKDLEGLKENQLDCFGEGLPKISTGLRCPGDPLDLAEFKRSLKYLPTVEDTAAPKASAVSVAPLKLTPEIKKKTETFKAKVPVWPHSVSIGSPARGGLYYPTTLENTDRISVRVGRHYGTQEMVTTIKKAVDDVHADFPDTPKLAVGDLSKKRGGLFRPHLSHQSGRDADIGYYLTKGHNTRRLMPARPHTLDVPRTWRFMESMIANDKVQYIFVDYGLMRSMYRYARDVRKMAPERLLEVFAYPRGRHARVAILRHLRGHADHMHVRFHAPESVSAVRELVRRHGRKVLQPVPVYAKIRRGDSLWKIARRHRTNIKKLTSWNRISRRKLLKPGAKLVVGWRSPRIPGEPKS
jgi:murein endopeptidase